MRHLLGDRHRRLEFAFVSLAIMAYVLFLCFEAGVSMKVFHF